jgi:hypothetical protein
MFGLGREILIISNISDGEEESSQKLSVEKERLLDMGRQDTTTPVTVTVTVYTTPEFRQVLGNQ